MSNYLKISEFARLRNVNINSLLYYEKIGVLRPAYVDPHSKYRYYSPEQLIILDTILLAINLGIPLKNLKNYVEGDTFLVQKLFEDGKKLAEAKMEDIQTTLRQIEYHLEDQKENRQYQNETGQYRRSIRERFFITAPCEHCQNPSDFRSMFTNLFEYAQSHHMTPISPSGRLFRYQNGRVSSWLFLEVLTVPPPEKESGHILRVPASIFTCVRKNMLDNKDLLSFIEKEFGPLKNSTVIVTNVLSDKFRFDSMQSEVQITDLI